MNPGTVTVIVTVKILPTVIIAATLAGGGYLYWNYRKGNLWKKSSQPSSVSP